MLGFLHRLVSRCLTTALGHVATQFGGPRKLMFEDWFMPRFGHPRHIELGSKFQPAVRLGRWHPPHCHRPWPTGGTPRAPPSSAAGPLPLDMPPVVEYVQWLAYLDRGPSHI
jgi:hypothetical protein